jgi:hypothetical protein
VADKVTLFGVAHKTVGDKPYFLSISLCHNTTLSFRIYKMPS